MVDELSQMEDYLEAARIPLRLACSTESGWPMGVSLWFLYQDGRLFSATQRSARVVAYLRKNPRCAFEIAADMPPYCGVRGQAVASIDENIGAQILDQLLIRYLGGMDNNLAKKLLSKREDEVAIVLRPVKVFTWDFSNRMLDVVESMLNLATKVCP